MGDGGGEAELRLDNIFPNGRDRCEAVGSGKDIAERADRGDPPVILRAIAVLLRRR